MANEETLDNALKTLSSAEDFLEFFGIEYDPHVVQVNRLHILQRFHDYLETAHSLPEDERLRRTLYTQRLKQAYEDFLHSDALTEKVFRVFNRQAKSDPTLIPVSAIRRS